VPPLCAILSIDGCYVVVQSYDFRGRKIKMGSSSALIVTLKLDTSTFAEVDALRKQYFPPERNFIPAHVTLFHALPEVEEKAIVEGLHRVCAVTPRMSLELSTLRFLGRGVAIECCSLELQKLRQVLSSAWHDWLIPQDRQSYRPHITIQNKVPPDTARQLYEHMTQTWHPLEAAGEGLWLWRYENGPWSLVEEFNFSSNS
jgi:2'-5' RNA ligase